MAKENKHLRNEFKDIKRRMDSSAISYRPSAMGSNAIEGTTTWQGCQSPAAGNKGDLI